MNTVAEILGEQLLQMGATGIEEISKRGSTRHLRCYFSSRKQKKGLQRKIRGEIRRLQKFFPTLQNSILEIKKYTDQSWKDRWKSFAKPILIQKKLGILSSSETKVPSHFPTDVKILRIDPQMAFGTGHHASTYLCLQELLRLSQLNGNTIQACLDWGTGSGILAIAAALLGIENILALDFDEEAIEVARKNIRKHGVENDIELRKGDLGVTKRRFSLIFANILFETLSQNLPRLKARLRKNGHLVLSGLLRNEETKMCESLKKNGFSNISVRRKTGWVSVTAQ